MLTIRNFFQRLKVSWSFLWGNKFPLVPSLGKIYLHESMPNAYLVRVPLKIEGCSGDYAFAMLMDSDYLEGRLVASYPELAYKHNAFSEAQNGLSKPSKGKKDT